MSGMNKAKIAVPVVAVIIIAGVFGLKAYSAKRGEAAIRDWLFDHDLQDRVNWRSVSASPFGGSFTLHDVELVGADLSVDEIELSNVRDERDRSSADIRFGSVISNADPKKRAGFLNVTGIDELMLSSGQRSLEPFDVRVHWDYQRDEQTATADFQAQLPGMFDVKASLGLNQAAGLIDTYVDALEKAREMPSLLSMGFGLLGLAEDQGAGRAELGNFTFELKDNGYFERTAALSKRYNFVPDPQANDWDEEREAAYKKAMADVTKKCQKELRDIGEQARTGCEIYTGLLSAENKGLTVTLEPDERVRLSEFLQIMGNSHRLGRLAERTHLKIDTL
jgi:hypothetical protein